MRTGATFGFATYISSILPDLESEIQLELLARTQYQINNKKMMKPSIDPIMAPMTSALVGDELAVGRGVGVGLSPRAKILVVDDAMMVTKTAVGVASARAVIGNPGIASRDLSLYRPHYEKKERKGKKWAAVYHHFLYDHAGRCG